MDDTLTKTFLAARKIADQAYEFYSPKTNDPKKPWLADQRFEGINPFNNQTEQGLFIEEYYGIPGSIWTPWGNWKCWGSGGGAVDKALKQFLAQFELELAHPTRVTPVGEIGPVHAVIGVEGISSLPRPILREKDPLGYYEAKEQWKKLLREN